MRPGSAAVLAVRLSLLVLLWGATRAPAIAQTLEVPVKATYLYKFAPFVEWGQGTFDSPASPLSLCVAGEDPFGAILDQAVAGKRFGQRPMVVRRMGVVSRGSKCHILYVAGSKAQPVAEGLKLVRGEPMLTVTDAARRGSDKGVIHFVVSGNRVRFEIDTAAAAVNGLSISSKLLSLALPRGRG